MDNLAPAPLAPRAPAARPIPDVATASRAAVWPIAMTGGDFFRAPLALGMLGPLIGAPQPLRLDFGLSHITRDGQRVGVAQGDVAALPFRALTAFSMEESGEERTLVVAPLSGHFAVITREMVAGLLPHGAVYVTDWLNARHVPAAAGDFGFDENIEAILTGVRRMGPGAHICALCQGAVPALAATAILAQHEPALAPATLTLIGGPVDPLANPTRVARLIRQRPLAALEAEALDTVDAAYAGAGRRVYPGRYQLSALTAYLCRQMGTGGELVGKIFADDGLDPVRFPFLRMFTALMDLPATYFLENIQKVFLERQVWTGGLRWRGQRVDFRAIRRTALMTVEGEADDIAAPGQTSAAHRLCPGIAAGRRARLLVRGAGHFSLFHGRPWRETVLPAMIAFREATIARGPHAAARPLARVAGIA